MTEEEFYRSLNQSSVNTNEKAFVTSRDKEYGLAMPALMRKVYVWMALALALTGVTAFGIAASPTLMLTIISNKVIFYGSMIGEIALVWYISARLQKLSLSTATMLFILYSILNGVTMSVIFLAFTFSSIAKVFFITAGTFGVMAVIGYTTKTDLSKFGKILLMGLIGIIIASVVNLFLKSNGFDMIVSYIGVLLFTGLTAYDVQAIKKLLMTQSDMSEGAQKLALIGALNLYLDFINLFLYLLRILGDRK